jgi:chemotaxis protein methyltransferase CheR
MKIIDSFINDKLKILVEGEFESKDDIDTFLDTLSKHEGVCEELSFLDARFLPPEVINVTQKLQHNSTIIYTNKRALRYYLSSIGIYNKYAFSYEEISKKSGIVTAIAIGGSAGSIEKVIEILKNIKKADVAIFIVVHIKDSAKSILAEILQKYTANYSVEEAQDNQLIQAGKIYVATPNKHMVVSGGRIFLTHTKKVAHSRPSIDVTFNSLALEYSDGLLAILLSGYGDDGSRSLKYIIDDGGYVIIEDPAKCHAKDMLNNAIKTNKYDSILPLDSIIKTINNRISRESGAKLSDKFLDDIMFKYGYDFKNYDKKLLQRRVEITKKRVEIEDNATFYKSVLEHKHLFEELFLDFSINVTTFFRNSDTFSSIRDKLFPYLSSYPEIKIWCAGCSTGEEPYSLAIILKELGLLHKSLIYATDFNDIKVKEAQNGIFSKDKFEIFKENYYKSGGKEEFKTYFNFNESYVSVSDEIKSKILFFKHNLASDGVLNEFQLVLCRNVMIYFDEELQKKVFFLMNNSLVRNGFLIYGESETLDCTKAGYKVVYDNKEKIYQKKGD